MINALQLHRRARETTCEEMVTARTCVAHNIRQCANNAQHVKATTLGPEAADDRLAYPEAIETADLPIVNNILGSRGVGIGPAVTTFTASETDSATHPAHALGEIPSWATMTAGGPLPTSTASILSPQATKILDRTSMLATSRASLDRIYSAVILPDGSIAAQPRENLRLVDWARNRAKGWGHAPVSADLLEIAIVAHNGVRRELGDAKANQRLAEREPHRRQIRANRAPPRPLPRPALRVGAEGQKRHCHQRQGLDNAR